MWHGPRSCSPQGADTADVTLHDIQLPYDHLTFDSTSQPEQYYSARLADLKAHAATGLTDGNGDKATAVTTLALCREYFCTTPAVDNRRLAVIIQSMRHRLRHSDSAAVNYRL